MNKAGPDEPSNFPMSQRGRNTNWISILFIMALLLVIVFYSFGIDASVVSYSFFEKQLEAKNVTSVQVYDTYLTGNFKIPPELPVVQDDSTMLSKGSSRPTKAKKAFIVYLPKDSQEVVQALNRAVDDPEYTDFSYEFVPTDASKLSFFLLLGLFIVSVVAVWMILRRGRDQFMGGGFLSGFAKSTAKRFEPSDQNVTFDDVAGLEGVKADLQEIVEFLKSPEKFQRLGGRVPKGVLLNGPPGTGKTLLARAVAGEAGVAFFSVNGSEFIQMFVGVGASRVRDLFATAKAQGSAIIFIDEIDAVGRQRGAGLGGGHDEREQTLNQILSEMDGFSQTDSVIVLAATNRPDVLDPALLRPGRFDRHITVGRPTLNGRLEIFKVHVRDVPLDNDVDLLRLAEGTVGLTGADIRNMVNEAALWAARHDRNTVGAADFDYARDKILMGAKREEVMLPEEKKKTAYHEAGHTLGAWFLQGAQRVHKVTIIPRGRSLGSTHIVPSEDRMSISESEVRDQLVVLLAGRAAERLIYHEATAGAENDLERATSLARRMVASWGMSHKLGPISFKLSDDDPFLGREIHQQRLFSEHTLELIDAEVGLILRTADEQAITLLRERQQELQRLTDALLDREELSEAEITELIGPSIHAERRREAGLAEEAAKVDRVV